MRRFTFAILLFVIIPSPVLFASEMLTRAEGLKIIWEPLKRPADVTREQPFADVRDLHPNFILITFAKARGIVDDGNQFFPNEPLRLKDALLWLLRTRNVDSWENIRNDALTTFITKFPIQISPQDITDNADISREKLTTMMQSLDDSLKNELHSVSYYAENFAGERTAFGEVFDPNALTAAHRTLPQNTLVRVTNHENGKSVTVRINDRGPYVNGRDMDLSRAAFGRITSLDHGVIGNVTFERVGYATENANCSATRYRRRIGKAFLSPGIPNVVKIGTTVTLESDALFRLIQMRIPGSKPLRSNEMTKKLELSFDRVGTYVLVLSENGGTRKRFRTMVIAGCE